MSDGSGRRRRNARLRRDGAVVAVIGKTPRAIPPT